MRDKSYNVTASKKMHMRDMTVLLTGGTGYLGSSILTKLVNKGYHVILLKRSFSNTSRIDRCLEKINTYNIDLVSLETVFAENSIDLILHCATNYGRKDNDPLNIIDTNLLFPLKLLELGKKNDVRCFINTDTILDKRISHYALSKKQFKEWLYAYHKDLACVNVALEHFYGPGDDETKFVTYIVQRLLKNVDKIDLTSGEQKRDFIYIDDIVDAFVKIVEVSCDLENGFHEFEVGSNSPIAIKDFVKLAKQLTNNDHTILNFGAIPYRENEVMDCYTNIAEISRLGWKCNVTLKDGLTRMIDAEKTLLDSD